MQPVITSYYDDKTGNYLCCYYATLTPTFLITVVSTFEMLWSDLMSSVTSLHLKYFSRIITLFMPRQMHFFPPNFLKDPVRFPHAAANSWCWNKASENRSRQLLVWIWLLYSQSKHKPTCIKEVNLTFGLRSKLPCRDVLWRKLQSDMSVR